MLVLLSCSAMSCPAQPACLLSLPLPHLTGAAFCLSHCFGVSAGQGKARQDKASAAPARIIGRKQRDAGFHVAGCRRTVGCGLERRREALAVAAMIGRAWRSLEAHCPAQGRTVSRARGAAFFLLYLPTSLPAPPPPPRTPVLTPGQVVKEGRGCEGVREEMSGRASADVQRTL